MGQTSGPDVRIVALGNPDRGDDGAAMLVASRFQGRVPVVLAGRPGAGLLDLMAPSGWCLLLDVTCSGSPAGTLHEIPLEELTPGTLPDARVSSHGFGPGEALALGRALGRKLPRGLFLGIEGVNFRQGGEMSQEVLNNLAGMEAMVARAISTLS